MHLSTSVFTFCVLSTTVILMVESYGFRYSRTPGSNDCRLQLNLPGYPPSYHSPIANSNHRYTGNKASYSGSSYNSNTGNGRPQPSSSDGYAFSSSSTNSATTNSNRRPVGSGNYHEGSQSYNQATSKGYQTQDTLGVYCKSGEYYSQSRQRCIVIGSGTSGTIKINEQDSYNSEDYDSSYNYNTGGNYDNYESSNSNSNYNSGESYNSNANYNSDNYGTSGNNYVSGDSGSNYNNYNYYESSYEQSAPDQDYNTNTNYNYNLKNHGSSSSSEFGHQETDYDSGNSKTGSFTGESGGGGSSFSSSSSSKSHSKTTGSSNINANSVGLGSNALPYDIKFAEEALDAHNLYRAKHLSAPLILDDKLNKFAQALANKLASGLPFGHSAEAKAGKYGENIAVRSGPTSGSAAVDSWYKEEVNYDYDNPTLELLPQSKSNAHFSAVVWSSSTKLGVGKAVSKDGRTFVVANYYPPGNYPSKLRQNVFRPKRG